jgi:iron complex outermembrane receptor protein
MRWRGPAGLLLVACSAARPARAQAPVCSTMRADSVARWGSPLDRAVSLPPATRALRDAIDRVAALAALRVSYSAEQLPLGRGVCLGAEGAPAGSVLVALLRDMNVDVVAVGGDQVVLAARREPARSAPEMAATVGMLERVVVTGSATGNGAPARELPMSVSIVDGAQLARSSSGTLADALDMFVPGMWAWAQSPASLIGSYASIRGASSFGLSYPKVYVDGIEMANPLLLSRFDAGAIDHIEVIRGPQGSALYGTDAISGVINIVTRHDGASPDGTRAEVQSSAGVAQSDFPRGVLAQEHTVSYAAGTGARSADVRLQAGSIGAFIPNAYNRRLMTTAAARIVGPSTSFSATGRLFLEDAGASSSPLVSRPLVRPGDDLPAGASVTGPQSAREYTVGATTTTTITDQLTMSFVAGIDGYRLANVQANFTPVPSVLDSALRAAEGSATRGTFRLSGVYRWNGDAPTHATMTLAMEQAALRVSSFQLVNEENDTRGQGDGGRATAVRARVADWQNSGGVAAQTNIAFANTLFLTGGARLEHDSRLVNVRPFELLPLLGAAVVRDIGPIAVKVRAAYGKGIRPPTTTARLQFWQPQRDELAAAPLGPERQAGTEVGIDLAFRRGVTLQATRFDQRASGLIQQVAIAADTTSHGRRLLYVAQNVGEITNRGWELQGTASLSRLAVNGALTVVDSRVQRLAPGYAGDLRPSDRILQVPARTAALTLEWNAPRWRASIGGSRAFDWINYDELRLTNAIAAGTYPARDLTGPKLRGYWRRYDGNWRVHAALSRTIRSGLSLELSGDNLLDHQTGEPDNITVLPGRTIMTGLRFRF